MLTGAGNRASEATALASALGRLKGPLMKVAQLMATIPDLLPPEYAAELQKLQSEAPPMGWAFVKRRMMAELGPDWEKKFESFEHQPAAAASLGQVHRARSLDGAQLACKLQYPDMQSAVEADLAQLEWLLAIRRRFDSAIDTSEIGKEIGARVREELDYRREAKHVALYREMLDGIDIVRVPRAWPELSTGRLLTLDWLDGTKMLAHKNDPLAVRNRLATAMFTAWWFPFSRFGVIHGDPHLGNYTVFEHDGEPAGINLLDYGCIRIFAPKFVGGVVDLYHGLLHGKDDLIVNAYETWGFRKLSRELIDTLNIWARFIYAPLLDDRVRTVADGVAPARIRPPRSVPGASGAQAERPGEGAARIRVHGSRRDRARRGVSAPRRGAELLSSVQRGDREVFARPRRQAPGGGLGAGGPGLAAIAVDALRAPPARFSETPAAGRLRPPRQAA